MKRLKTFMLGVMLMMLSNHALAATTTAPVSMTVTAGVIASCTIATTPVNFGNSVAFSGYANRPAATGSVDVTCSSALAYTIAIDGGLNSSASGRRMVDSTGTLTAGSGHALSYRLRQPDNTTLWGDCTAAAVCGTWGYTSAQVVTSSGTGSLQNHTVNAEIITTGSFGLALALPGVFNDTVNVTVSY